MRKILKGKENMSSCTRKNHKKDKVTIQKSQIQHRQQKQILETQTQWVSTTLSYSSNF